MTAVQAVLALLILLSQLLAWRYFNARLRRKFPKAILNLVYILFNIMGIYALLTVFLLKFPPPSFFLWDFVVRPGILWELAHLFWLCPAALLALAGGLWNRFLRREPKGLSKLFLRERPGPRLSDPVGLALAAMLALSFYGYARQLSPPEVTREEIFYPDLPQELDGFRMALASDFHYGAGQNRQELQRSFAAIAAERPDIVLLLGDMVSSNSLLAVDYREPLALVAGAPYGVWGVLGNHDHYSENPHNVLQLLSNERANILSDRRDNVRGLPLTLIGFDDPGTRDFDLYPLSVPDENRPLPFQAVQGPAAPPDNFIVVLTHRPSGAADAARHGVDLYLAGHTRGGDFRIPGFRAANPASLFYTYTSGRYQLDGMEICVTRGLAAPVSPFRLFAWPEVTLVTLRRGPKPTPEDGQAPPPSGTGTPARAEPTEGGPDAGPAPATPDSGPASDEAGDVTGPGVTGDAGTAAPAAEGAGETAGDAASGDAGQGRPPARSRTPRQPSQ
ncbi:MAG: metallophosphoesterase [Deltaproteobacteria bacterium]|jgi:predicted MPP superfamily phosphohydrolase|nr:metallophosphoesterase [Deltaproteobacteria bacterium]